MSSNTITVSNISKTYKVYPRPKDRLLELVLPGKRHQPFQALKNISFSVKKGQTLGIVGHNGSGKSTLLQIICGTLTPSKGSVETTGRIAALLELGAGFNPEFTGHENIELSAAINGMSAEELSTRYRDIVSFSGLDEAHLNQPVKTYSSGQYVRLAFSIAIASEPDILVVDEALSVGDVAFQRKCFSRIRELQASGTTVLFVSHSPNAVIELCDRVVLLDKGQLIMEGAPAAVIAQYNRLMFAPPSALASIRKEIISGKKPRKTKKTKGASASFDPSLVPESQVAYAANGATISNVKITSLAKKPVNILKMGKEYLYSYSVTFDEPATKLRFGMNIKTNTGIVLGGASTHTEAKPFPKAAKGQRVDITFRFTCNLLPGTYFTNAGCTAIKNKERISLHRILDAVMFRVEESRETTATGKVNFGISSAVKTR